MTAADATVANVTGVALGSFAEVAIKRCELSQELLQTKGFACLWRAGHKLRLATWGFSRAQT